ncbi:MAG: hypothetical protein ABW023_08535 [Sphingomonas sp.]
MEARGGDRHWWWLLGALVALGFALRLAGAQGALWLDEAWSAVLAHDAGTPLGIFLNINHDNNHHLNSLWMQFAGFGAPPPLVRALSILTGSVAILVAGLIGRRRSPILGLVTATLFAFSPILVTLGSEARGYAPMTLALLTAILLTDRWLEGDAERSPATALALCFFLGALSQLTMFFGFCAIAGWVFFALWKRSTPAQAIGGALKLLLPSAIAMAAVAGIVFGAAAASKTGFQFGRYDPFDWLQYLHAIVEMLGYTLGVPIVSVWWLAFAPILVVFAAGAQVSRLAFYRLAIVAFPVALAVLQSGNVGHPRYYLLAGIALLLLVAEMLSLGLRTPGWKRGLASIAIGVITIGSLVQDVDLIRNQRGDPGAAIRALQARAPGGTGIILDRSTGLAMLQVAAAQDRYKLDILENKPCGPARFLFIDRFKGETMPAASIRCGRRYLPIARAYARGLSGSHWTLYELQP